MFEKKKSGFYKTSERNELGDPLGRTRKGNRWAAKQLEKLLYVVKIERPKKEFASQKLQKQEWGGCIMDKADNGAGRSIEAFGGEKGVNEPS